jgi:hypothetical protein
VKTVTCLQGRNQIDTTFLAARSRPTFFVLSFMQSLTISAIFGASRRRWSRSEGWSMTSLKENIKIGAKAVSHGRYVAIQMAEVATSRYLFADIQRLIAKLRPPPDPAPA